jgi:cytochrome c
MTQMLDKRHGYWLLWSVGFLFLAFVGLTACGRLAETSPRHNVPGGDPDRGRTALREYGCHTCHTIPGVQGADATVAPPLNYWADRHYIAGRFPNNPDNLIPWIMNPQTLVPGSAMPDMGVSEADARDMSAYLYTLRRGR